MNQQVKPYAPLTADNAALVLVDHQIGLLNGVRDYSAAELTHNVVALAKAARVLKLPTVITTTAADTLWGPTLPELVGGPTGHSDYRPDIGKRLGRSQGGGRHQGNRAPQADLRRHLTRDLCHPPRDHGSRQGL